MGGTFNPPHMGHIALAKKALKDFGLEYVIFVPAGIPPHKKNIDIASKTDRLQMTKLAIKGIDFPCLCKTTPVVATDAPIIETIIAINNGI